MGLFERLPDHDPLLDEEPDEADAELRVMDYTEMTPQPALPPARLPQARRGARRRGGPSGANSAISRQSNTETERGLLSEYLVDVRVTPRAGLLDPEGKAIHHALHSLGFADVDEVRVGKLIACG